ncbi:hypothetical protein [uncultured Desulfovibrio sp.]|uniref:baseplate J/gp47 family protein n=1 Tax=uncultured Desulfovibrio sp. TaxID=167968 RepID=UPI00260A7196|nr:hypothetical protein [uncultured Desulfovibrio sp.]
MALAYIDETGLHLPDYPTVLAAVQEAMRAIYGPDLYLEADSQDGQLAAVFAVALHDTFALAGAVYNSYSPQTAQGAGLSRMVVVNGLRRAGSSRSSVDMRLVGQPGAVVRDGVVADSAGTRWLLPATVSIGLDGEATVTAYAENSGAVRAAAGELTEICTPQRGWQKAYNPQAATVGLPVERDAELRERQRHSTALPSRSVFEGTLGAIAAVPGVARWRGYENDGNVPDANGVPPHSICVVVDGGDSRAIAQVIARKKTPGTGTHGDIAVDVLDERGVPGQIRFFRPKMRQIAVRITLVPHAGYVGATGDAVRAAVSAWINALPIGEDVLRSRLYCPINDADPGASSAGAYDTGGHRLRTFDVAGLELGFPGGGLSAANVTIGYTEATMCYVDDVEVVLV